MLFTECGRFSSRSVSFRACSLASAQADRAHTAAQQAAARAWVAGRGRALFRVECAARQPGAHAVPQGRHRDGGAVQVQLHARPRQCRRSLNGRLPAGAYIGSHSPSAASCAASAAPAQPDQATACWSLDRQALTANCLISELIGGA